MTTMWILMVLGLVVLAGAVGAVTLRNLVHCALALILSFTGIAGVFLHLNAEFLGWVQILVYVGAVGILLVFAVLLTRGGDDTSARFAVGWKWGVGIAGVMGLVWVMGVLGSPFLERATVAGVAPAPTVAVAEVGRVMMRDYVVPLEILGVLLTAALIGAMVIALPGGRETAEEGEGRVEDEGKAVTKRVEG